MDRVIEENLYVESDGWTVDLVATVVRRLARAGLPCPMGVRVIWMAEPTAFTLADGRIYVSRELLSRGLGEGGLAFVIAHELGHHELGHFRLHDRVSRWTGSFWLAALWVLLTSPIRWITRVDVQKELAADALAARVCLRAGYTPASILNALKVLRRHALDRRWLDAVWGATTRSLLVGWSTLRASHPPIDDRLDRARYVLETYAPPRAPAWLRGDGLPSRARELSAAGRAVGRWRPPRSSTSATRPTRAHSVISADPRGSRGASSVVSRGCRAGFDCPATSTST